MSIGMAVAVAIDVFRRGHHPYRDGAAGWGKLDRVGKQVVQNLDRRVGIRRHHVQPILRLEHQHRCCLAVALARWFSTTPAASAARSQRLAAQIDLALVDGLRAQELVEQVAHAPAGRLRMRAMDSVCISSRFCVPKSRMSWAKPMIELSGLRRSCAATPRKALRSLSSSSRRMLAAEQFVEDEVELVQRVAAAPFEEHPDHRHEERQRQVTRGGDGALPARRVERVQRHARQIERDKHSHDE